MTNITVENSVAKEEFLKVAYELTEKQRQAFYNSVICKDGDQWCVQGGSDLMTDHIGFGSTISEAVSNFVACIKHS